MDVIRGISLPEIVELDITLNRELIVRWDHDDDSITWSYQV